MSSKRARHGRYTFASWNELFVRALAETLPDWRFSPAEAGGRKVKQVVQLPLKFVARHQ